MSQGSRQTASNAESRADSSLPQWPPEMTRCGGALACGRHHSHTGAFRGSELRFLRVKALRSHEREPAPQASRACLHKSDAPSEPPISLPRLPGRHRPHGSPCPAAGSSSSHSGRAGSSGMTQVFYAQVLRALPEAHCSYASPHRLPEVGISRGLESFCAARETTGGKGRQAAQHPRENQQQASAHRSKNAPEGATPAAPRLPPSHSPGSGLWMGVEIKESYQTPRVSRGKGTRERTLQVDPKTSREVGGGEGFNQEQRERALLEPSTPPAISTHISRGREGLQGHGPRPGATEHKDSGRDFKGRRRAEVPTQELPAEEPKHQSLRSTVTQGIHVIRVLHGACEHVQTLCVHKDAVASLPV